MRFLGIGLILGGYTLVYAAVANRGKFATEPWAGLFMDAYETPEQQAVIGVVQGAADALVTAGTKLTSNRPNTNGQ